jgi:hypothetical protein
MTPEQKERALHLLNNSDKMHTKLLASLYEELTGIKINGCFCTPRSRTTFREQFLNEFKTQLSDEKE